MPRDKDATLAHTYGLLSLVPGLGSLFALFNQSKPWYDYIVWGSGWLMALILATYLLRVSKRSREDGLTIGAMEGEAKDLERQVQALTNTLDYLSTRLATVPALPRRTKTGGGNTDG